MANCLIAQSGGPSAVINASLAGLIRANQISSLYENVYGALYGFDGVLGEGFYNLTNISSSELDILRQTPSCALGTARHMLSREDDEDCKRVIDIMQRHNIGCFFYIGGNGSLDTVAALADYARSHNLPQRFIGVPKTVDNDIRLLDHSPGFPSAASVACQITHATYLDYAAFTRPEVFILETMGRDTGWLAASCCLTGDVDLLVLPEVDFDKDRFLDLVKRKFDEKGSCYIVTSEGAHYADGQYVAATSDVVRGTAYAVLGGAAEKMKQMILEAGIVPRAVVQNLSRVARSSNFAESLVDTNEAYELGFAAHMRSVLPRYNGYMVGVAPRKHFGEPYDAQYFAIPASKVANYVKQFPSEWILPDYGGITDEAKLYYEPLIQERPKLIYKNGRPATIVPYNLRSTNDKECATWK